MSAELLRRAAETLRGRVHNLPGAMGDRPWRLVLTDSEGGLDGVAACADHLGASEQACDGCWTVETPRESAAVYIALMHPPVALALATWLDAAADVVEANYAHDGFDLDAIDDTYRGAVTTARAVLRAGGQ